ncbi:hypothetical protein [Halorussus caseinilyticus]|uniref:Uncharacterized protein n=1 Tax=Halorussus caseinilyticus TaxID=3034025 RepID=A0ABD5WL41_9EURY|nr:hypothetical protein [Halorussus sp. DT72]
MNRRELLHRGGALAAAAGLAGCLGSTGTDAPTTDGDRTTDRGTTTDSERDGDSGAGGSGGEFSGVRSDDENPFRTISVGSREAVPFPDNNQPRRVRVWNATEGSREIEIRVSRGSETPVDRTVEFETDAYLTVLLNEPDDYRVAVTPEGGDATTVEFSRASFDCNSATTDAGVMPDGSVETISASTAAGCPSPEVADTSLSVGKGDCGTEHRATVEFAGEKVEVRGAVRAPTPRSDLALAGTDYDRTADALTVRVRATGEDGGEPGTQCTGEVAYQATVGLNYALPSEVAVVHESMNETVEVTRADRGGD